jgi:hypothetical protein
MKPQRKIPAGNNSACTSIPLSVCFRPSIIPNGLPSGQCQCIDGGAARDNALPYHGAGSRAPWSGKHTLEVWRMKGEGPAFSKLGGRLVRYQSAALDAFIAATRRSNSVGDTIN